MWHFLPSALAFLGYPITDFWYSHLHWTSVRRCLPPIPIRSLLFSPEKFLRSPISFVKFFHTVYLTNLKGNVGLIITDFWYSHLLGTSVRRCLPPIPIRSLLFSPEKFLRSPISFVKFLHTIYLTNLKGNVCLILTKDSVIFHTRDICSPHSRLFLFCCKWRHRNRLL